VYLRLLLEEFLLRAVREEFWSEQKIFRRVSKAPPRRPLHSPFRCLSPRRPRAARPKTVAHLQTQNHISSPILQQRYSSDKIQTYRLPLNHRPLPFSASALAGSAVVLVRFRLKAKSFRSPSPLPPNERTINSLSRQNSSRWVKVEPLKVERRNAGRHSGRHKRPHVFFARKWSSKWRPC